jgi:hypothetical protein
VSDVSEYTMHKNACMPGGWDSNFCSGVRHMSFRARAASRSVPFRPNFRDGAGEKSALRGSATLIQRGTMQIPRAQPLCISVRTTNRGSGCALGMTRTLTSSHESESHPWPRPVFQLSGILQQHQGVMFVRTAAQPIGSAIHASAERHVSRTQHAAAG